MTYRLTPADAGRCLGAYGTARVAGPGRPAGGQAAVRPGPDPRPGRSRRTSVQRAGLSLAAVACHAVGMGGPPVLRRVPRLAAEAGDFIRINDFVHLATFAPAGGGKSVSVLYPNLLSYEGNCVVVDPKGELYKLTHKHRQQAVRPYHRQARPGRAVTGRAATASTRSTGSIPSGPISSRSAGTWPTCWWCGPARKWTRTGAIPPKTSSRAFIAYICALEGNPAARNMRGVRAQIASRENYAQALEVMQQQAGFYGVLEELGHSLTWHVDKELGCVMTHAQRFTNIFGAPLVADSTGSTTLRPDAAADRAHDGLPDHPCRQDGGLGQACNGSGWAACCGSSRRGRRPRITRSCSSSMKRPTSAKCRRWKTP